MHNLAQFTEPGLLVPRLTGAHRESVIAELSHRLEQSGRIESADTFSRAVMEHEELAPTVYDGVAFALAHKGALQALSFAAGFVSRPIGWGKLRAPLVQMVVLFAVPAAVERNYSSLVLAFSNLLDRPDKLAALRACTRSEDIHAELAGLQFP